MVAPSTVRLIAVLVVAFVAVAAISSYLGQGFVSRSTSTLTETSTKFQAITSTQTQTVTSTASVATTRFVGVPLIKSITMANITVGGVPWNVGVDGATNRIFVTGPSSNATVIDGNTNKILASLSTGRPGSYYLAVNQVTHTVYVGDTVINGSSNRVVAHLNYSVSELAVNTNTNTLYATSIPKLSPPLHPSIPRFSSSTEGPTNSQEVYS